MEPNSLTPPSEPQAVYWTNAPADGLGWWFVSEGNSAPDAEVPPETRESYDVARNEVVNSTDASSNPTAPGTPHEEYETAARLGLGSSAEQQHDDSLVSDGEGSCTQEANSPFSEWGAGLPSLSSEEFPAAEGSLGDLVDEAVMVSAVDGGEDDEVSPWLADVVFRVTGLTPVIDFDVALWGPEATSDAPYAAWMPWMQGIAIALTSAAIVQRLEQRRETSRVQDSHTKPDRADAVLLALGLDVR